VVLAISLPYAARYGFWRSVLWSPTWFAFAFLRRLATLEAAISLPVRPFPVRARSGARPGAQGTRTGEPSAGEPSAGEPAGVLFEVPQQNPGNPVPIPTRPGLLLPEDD
jgi:hypothetical protein